jgi:hypothetical protein
MNYLYPIVAAVLLVLPAIAYAQDPPRSDPGVTPPPPDAATPKVDPGMIVKPPQTDPQSIAVPPKNVDPGITKDTGKIDKKTRKKTRPKSIPVPHD